MNSGRKSTNIWPLVAECLAALALLALLLTGFSQVTPANSVLSSASAAGHDPALTFPVEAGFSRTAPVSA